MKHNTTNGRRAIHAMPYFSHQVNPHTPLSFKKKNREPTKFNNRHRGILPNGDKIHPPKVIDTDSIENGRSISRGQASTRQKDPLIKLGYQDIEKVFTAASLLEMEIPENFWLVDKIILNGAINFLAGDSDCGKSSLLSQLGRDICNCSSYFLGFKINAKHNRVIYISTEDHPAGLSIKLKKQYGEIGDSDIELMNFAFIFQAENILVQIKELLLKKPADLVIIDAFADLVGGDLNSAFVIREFLEPLRVLTIEYNCAFVLVHHTTKVSQNRIPNKNDLVGSQAITAYARQVLMMSRDRVVQNLRTLKVVKGNYLGEEFKQGNIPLIFNGDSLTFDRRTEEKRLVYSTAGIDADLPTYPSTRKRRGRRYKLYLSDLNEILNLRDGGLTMQQIGIAYGVNKGTVSRFLKKHDVEK